MYLYNLINLPLLAAGAENEVASASSKYGQWSFWVENLLILVIGMAIVTFGISLLRMLTSKTDTSVPLRPIFTVLKWIGGLVVIGLILERFQVEVMTILTATLAMVAIGFVAVWSLISHVLATFLLLIMKPFRVNDDVNFVGEEVKGRVVDLNLFFTTLRISEQEHIQVPNNMFFQKALKISKGGDETELSAQFKRDKPADEKPD